MKHRTRILLAEDEPSLGQIVMESLESRGYEVTLCLDGKEAETKYHETEPHLLVLDVMMPKMDGYALCKKLKTDARTSHIPIILLTAKSSVEDKIQGIGYGIDDYIPKPFNSRFISMINKQLSVINDVKVQCWKGTGNVK